MSDAADRTDRFNDSRTVPEETKTFFPGVEPPTLPPMPCAPGLTAQNLVGRWFGDYEILAEVGRGGMGIVYRVRQRGLNRIVALKMLLPGALASGDELRRFFTEAEATAGLQHPNIVTIHEVGEADGCHFFSMDYIEGSSLSQRLKAGPVPGRTAARYVQTVARAMHHAHRHGILHRDLKPGNILLDREDQAHVTDFGLAKRLGSDSGHTRSGSVLGTPGYMAPEQAAGKVKDLGPATDIYGLGAVLYECLTGRPPFQAATAVDTVMQVLEREPVPPTLLNPNVEKDLETICLKCLDKDPTRRYASAEALAEDLRRYLDGEPISASSVNVFEYLARTLERSQSMGEFRTWGNMLLWFAGIVAGGHVLLYVLTHTPGGDRFVWPTRLVQFSLMGLIFWLNRTHRLLPTSNAERQLWSIWVGHFLASFAVVIACRPFVPDDDPHKNFLYIPWSLLSGLAFFVMGSNYWGRCYALGGGFLILAVVMRQQLEWAPIGFGALWAVALVTMGVHLRALAADAASAPPTMTNLPTSEQPTKKVG